MLFLAPVLLSVWGARRAPVLLRRMRERRRANAVEAAARAAAAARWRRGDAARELAKSHLATDEYARALELLDQAISDGHDDADARADRGLCLQQLGFHLDAIDDFDAAIAKEPNDSNLYLMRSWSKSGIGDFLGCVEDQKEAIRVSSIDNAAQRSHEAGAREQGHANLAALYRSYLCLSQLKLDAERDDEARRRQHPNVEHGPSLATRRRSEAKRRTPPTSR